MTVQKFINYKILNKDGIILIKFNLNEIIYKR